MNVDYDIIIAGGGLSGLWCAIELAPLYKVLLIDPDSYPRHKLCGEYLSAEVDQLLQSKNIHLDQLTPAKISEFQISLENGKQIKSVLPLGGYGISRYQLDLELFNKAAKDATITQDRVLELESHEDYQKVITSNRSFTCNQVIVATGKRSILDKNLQREFISTKSEWLAVKMHYQYEMPHNRVELHNFDGGYAGLSKVENGNVNLCYLTSFESFKKFKDVQIFQQEVLSKNKHLKEFFKTAKPLWKKPITISQISFGKKNITHTDYLFVGDCAGLIHPLCGNGMAMAFHSAHIASQHITLLLEGKQDRTTTITSYSKDWNKQFSSRMRYGNWIQSILLRKKWSMVMYGAIARFPFLLTMIIKKTHGKPLNS